MKTILSFVVFSSVACVVYSAATKEISSKLAAAKKTCQEKFKEDYDAIQDLYKSGKELNDEGKCLTACILDHMGYLKDGKADLDAFKESGKQKYPDDDGNRGKADQVAAICVEKVPESDNECEYAHSLVVCFVAEAKKIDLDDPDYEDDDDEEGDDE